jgi:hypothetical protein
MPEELTAMTEEQIRGLAQKLDSLDLNESDQAFLGGLLCCGTQFLTDQIEEERKKDPEGVPEITFQPAPSAGESLLSALVLTEVESEVGLFEWAYGIFCSWKPVVTVCSGDKSSENCVTLKVPSCSTSELVPGPSSSSDAGTSP